MNHIHHSNTEQKVSSLGKCYKTVDVDQNIALFPCRAEQLLLSLVTSLQTGPHTPHTAAHPTLPRPQLRTITQTPPHCDSADWCTGSTVVSCNKYSISLGEQCCLGIKYNLDNPSLHLIFHITDLISLIKIYSEAINPKFGVFDSHDHYHNIS